MELSKVILTILSFMVPQIVTQLESEKICGKLFTDPISNFIGSDLILKVQLTNHSEVYNQNEKYTQVFKVLKNYIDWIQVDDLVEVGFFGRQDPAKCVAGEMREDLIYTIFVDFEYDGIHSLSAMPILWDESTDRVFDDLVYNPDKVLIEPSTKAIKREFVAENGEELILECTANGYPPPLFRWWYKNMPIQTHKDLEHNVTSSHNSTQVKLLKTEAIFYRFVCEALNVAGFSKVIIEINKHLINEDAHDHDTIPCPPSNSLPCRNNAACRIDIHTGRKMCRCRGFYIGELCDRFYDYTRQKNRGIFKLFDLDMTKQVLIIAPVVAFMLLGVIIIIILVYTKHKNQKVTYMEANQHQEEI